MVFLIFVTYNERKLIKKSGLNFVLYFTIKFRIPKLIAAALIFKS